MTAVFDGANSSFRRTLVRLKRPGSGRGEHPSTGFRRTLVRLKRAQTHQNARPFGLFQTNSREVEAVHVAIRAYWYFPFQTNSREVEASGMAGSSGIWASFRRTLVRLKHGCLTTGTRNTLVSDELS